jgi:SAM-dependent methyltransferase
VRPPKEIFRVRPAFDARRANALYLYVPMPYTYTIPTSPSFIDKGLLGYTLSPLKQKNLEIYYIESEKGHDTFIVSKKITRTYYILSGSGHFTIDQKQYPVEPGVFVEVPPKVEYSYSGKMAILCFSIPRWVKGNDRVTKWNPDVVGFDSPCTAVDRSWWARLIRVSIFGKSPMNAFLRINRRLWPKVPAKLVSPDSMQSYGRVLHKIVCAQGQREPFYPTFFLGNRSKLELIRRLADRKKLGETLSVTVLGCRTGAEAYSVAWRIRSARPDLRLILHAVDASKPAVEFAKRGVYLPATSPFAGTANFERLTAAEMAELFDRNGDVMTVKSWIRENIHWRVGDAARWETLDLPGPQDVVVANNLFYHLDASEAERCLRNMARLVKPGGFLFVSGVDLNIRSRIARDLGWKPLPDLLEEIHEDDRKLGSCWPWNYAGVEPFNQRRKDWKLRYAAGFQLAAHRADDGPGPEMVEPAARDGNSENPGRLQNLAS